MSQTNEASGKKQTVKGKRKIALTAAFVASLFFPMLLSLIGFFLSIWIVIPAPTFFLLPFGIGAPEVCPWLIGVNAIALLLALLTLHKGWISGVAVAISIISFILSTLPLLQLPGANARVATEMQRILGPEYLAAIPEYQKQLLRPQPFVWLDVFRGIAIPEVRITKAMPFVAPDGITLRLNAYRPLAAGIYPTIVVIYGGAWRSGTPDNDEMFSRYMAAQGYTVLTIDYRHAPQYQFPTQIEDVKTALRYIGQHHQALEVDSERVVLMGRSAGAHLAMLAAYQSNVFPVRAVVNYYGPIDLTKGYNDPPKPDPIDTRAVLKDFLGGTPTELPDRYRQASPISYVTQPLPPSLLVYAGRDHLVQSKFGWELYQQLQKTGSHTVWLEIPWAEHAFDAIFNGVSNQLALYYTERFLAWATAKKQ